MEVAASLASMGTRKKGRPEADVHDGARGWLRGAVEEIVGLTQHSGGSATESAARAVQYAQRIAELRAWARGASARGPSSTFGSADGSSTGCWQQPSYDLQHLVDEADPWAEWARRRADLVSDAVQELEHVFQSDAVGQFDSGPSANALGHAVALHDWAHLRRRPDALAGGVGNRRGSAEDGAMRAQWALEQADHMDSFVSLAERHLQAAASRSLQQGDAGSGPLATCREHAAELREWSAAGAKLQVLPSAPGLDRQLERDGSGGVLGPDGRFDASWLWTAQKEQHLMRTVQAFEQAARGEGGYPPQSARETLASSLWARLDDLEALAAERLNRGAPLLADPNAVHLQTAAVDVEMLELVRDAVGQMPQPLGAGSDQDRQVGQWGEEWVYRWLKTKHESDGAVVEWLNETSEQFRPYDITVTSADGAVEHFEVKSTTTLDKQYVEITEPEVIEAARLQRGFSLVCVYAAGTQAALMTKVPNPSAQWQSQRKKTSGIELLVRIPIPSQQGESRSR